ncbi:maltose acetyltransferase domain-containing protein [Arthrobacter jiangjiafuii]|uniref:maltose acetyltransferase domain-containing protein n=1 Tax=Arthrobacter jiangjiafuii TaxID=2817475 RepID=UPI001F3C1C2E|nr:maltose acetyltransferase domain-containing protein [Arthrobacter jiangjiafuii]
MPGVVSNPNLHIADDPELARDSLRAIGLADRYNRIWAQDRSGAAGILRELLIGLGEDSEIRAPLYRRDKLEAAKPIAIGNNSP